MGKKTALEKRVKRKLHAQEASAKTTQRKAAAMEKAAARTRVATRTRRRQSRRSSRRSKETANSKLTKDDLYFKTATGKKQVSDMVRKAFSKRKEESDSKPGVVHGTNGEELGSSIHEWQYPKWLVPRGS